MLGLQLKEKCSVCGTIVNTEYGITTLYNDSNGEFYFDNDDSNACPNCGHHINSERIADAICMGIICL